MDIISNYDLYRRRYPHDICVLYWGWLDYTFSMDTKTGIHLNY